MTRRCNMNCAYCSQAEFDRTHNLDLKAFTENVLDKVDIRLLIITGGEPLIRFSELIDLIKKCKSRNIEVGIFSNAVLISMQKAEMIRDAGVSWVRVSINGENSKTHELSYPKGSFEKTIEGINNLKKAGVYVKVRSTVTTKNIDSIVGIVGLCKKLGISEVDFRPYLHLGECNPHGDYALDTHSELIALSKLIRLQEVEKDIYIKLLPNWFDFLVRDLSNVDEKIRIEDCHCGRKYLYIDADGNYRPCAGHRLVLGSMYKDNVNELWEKSSFLEEIRNYQQNEYCKTCPMCIKCHTANCHLINYELDGSFYAVNRTCPIYNFDRENSANGFEKVRREFLEYYSRYSQVYMR